MEKHTPLPWLFLEEVQKANAAQIRGASGQEIAFDVYTPNADLICRAVNSYKELLQVAEFIIQRHAEVSLHPQLTNKDVDRIRGVVDRATNGAE